MQSDPPVVGSGLGSQQLLGQQVGAEAAAVAVVLVGGTIVGAAPALSAGSLL